ncbi:hypothetical protein CVU82_02375 [Candidatus Falkowbacteria bacterium HGW-Falkowbacteria-1]|jgi:hypothetical protein|uniref:Uncharacterized protein n=1 Tax=Candidatus Falkowbacteria bacterium HGW-Falkowbacteria-1 TaxID=2013768 RepID=A0A2N2E9R4_9BACT|nr:MAG: hypothetical protein CVU82_02375 [Candidatus Falkowbacteria bacterium HGW-Falkowbacteria-1]
MIKILGRIELPQENKKERYLGIEESVKILKLELNGISRKVNESYGAILDESACLTMDGQDLDLHNKALKSKEMAWASESGMDIEEWKAKRERNPANIAEMAVTVLLHKLIGDKFIVARASKYDDYEHGVDNVLIDKKTGAVVCGFDQVLGIGKDDGSDKKRDKIKNILLKGGAKLEYGVTLDENQKIKRQKIKNIPAFFLGISKEDLMKLVVDLKENKEKEVGGEILTKILNSLKEQHQAAKSLLNELMGSNNEELLRNIDKFEQLLVSLEEGF